MGTPAVFSGAGTREAGVRPRHRVRPRAAPRIHFCWYGILVRPAIFWARAPASSPISSAAASTPSPSSPSTSTTFFFFFFFKLGSNATYAHRGRTTGVSHASGIVERPPGFPPLTLQPPPPREKPTSYQGSPSPTRPRTETAYVVSNTAGERTSSSGSAMLASGAYTVACLSFKGAREQGL